MVTRDLSIDVKMIVLNMFPIPILRFMVHILSHCKSIIVKNCFYVFSKILQPCCVWNVPNMLVKSEVLKLIYQFLPSHSICIYEFAMVIKYMLSYDDGAGPDFNYAPMLQVSLCFRVHNS